MKSNYNNIKVHTGDPAIDSVRDAISKVIKQRNNAASKYSKKLKELKLKENAAIQKIKDRFKPLQGSVEEKLREIDQKYTHHRSRLDRMLRIATNGNDSATHRRK